MQRRTFIKNSIFAASAMSLYSCGLNASAQSFDVTFMVGADTHFDPPPESDQYFHIHAMNNLPGQLVWPGKINGQPTHFGGQGEKMKTPQGLVLAGDILNEADEPALELFKKRYEQGTGDKQIHYPVYLGLGNHDVNPVLEGPEKLEGRARMWNYVESRHKGPNAPTPVGNFDAASRNYSWNWGKLHLIQTHLFAGATSENQPNSLKWLSQDLIRFASEGQPVVIIQHYGFDEWAIEWWSDQERKKLFDILNQYNVVGIFSGHTHTAINMSWNNHPVFEVNNAWPDSDGNGSFAIVHITDRYMDMATCRWLNGNGDVELIGPFYSCRFDK